MDNQGIDDISLDGLEFGRLNQKRARGVSIRSIGKEGEAKEDSLGELKCRRKIFSEGLAMKLKRI